MYVLSVYAEILTIPYVTASARYQLVKITRDNSEDVYRATRRTKTYWIGLSRDQGWRWTNGMVFTHRVGWGWGDNYLHAHTVATGFPIEPPLGCQATREREMFYLTTHSTHLIYGYMASDIWLRTILIVRKETRCRHIGYSYRLAARVILYAPSHRQDNTYHGLCYTSRGLLAGTRSSSMGPPHEGSIRRPIVRPFLGLIWAT